MLKTIIIEATEAFNPERRGIGTQMRAWIEAAPFDEFSDYTFIVAHRQLATMDEVHVRGSNVQTRSVQAPSEESYIDQLYAYKPHVIFFPMADSKYVRHGATQCVGVDYGMEDFYCRDYIASYDPMTSLLKHKTALQAFTGIVTVSRTSQRDLAWFFPEYKDKVTVVYPGVVSAKRNNEPGGLPPELKDAQFLLIVGYEKKKNIKRITTAFDAFKAQTGSQLKLVIVGKPGYGAHEIDEHIKTLAHQADIMRLGYVSEGQKQLLLTRCYALVALPIYEGFGISALEGLAAGKVVLVSNNGSLKEVAGNAGYFADPFSVESMTKQLVQMSKLKGNPKQHYITKRLALFDQTVQSRTLLKRLTSFA